MQLENQGTPTPGFQAEAAAATLQPAGFWIRFGAAFIDGIVLRILGGIVGFAIGFVGALLHFPSPAIKTLAFLVGIALAFGYAGYFLSEKGATPGKSICGLVVLDSDLGGHLTFMKACQRELAKVLSAIILLGGFIMAGVRKDKKALHDLIVGSQVFKKAK